MAKGKRGFARKAANQSVRNARQARQVARQTAGKSDDRQARRDFRQARGARQDLVRAQKSGDQARIDKARSAILDEYYSQYGLAQAAIDQSPALKQLFRDAVTEGWTDQKFQNELQQSSWYQDNSDSWRAAFTAEYVGSDADWTALLSDATESVRVAAANAGVSLDDTTLAAMARQYLYEGWDKTPARMNTALASKFTGKNDANVEGDFTATGTTGTSIDALKKLAYDNGVKMPDSFYERAARDVITNPDLLANYERGIRQVAATTYGAYATDIMEGNLTTSDLAAGYINAMQNELEIDNIDVFDSTIQQALTGVTDSSGKQSVMNMFDFRKSLRKDPRWLDTKNAQDIYTRVGSALSRAFGVGA